jgi:Kef-type K+ transport system membrane component KefB
MDNDLNKRYQTQIILWFAILMNIGVFFLISVFAVSTTAEPEATSAKLLLIAIAAAATFMVIMSFVVKRKMLDRSVDTQDVSLVQKALVLACAMCEVAAVLGLIERMVVRNNDFYVLFAIAIIGTALHFPKRAQLEAASYRNTSGNSI